MESGGLNNFFIVERTMCLGIYRKACVISEKPLCLFIQVIIDGMR